MSRLTRTSKYILAALGAVVIFTVGTLALTTPSGGELNNTLCLSCHAIKENVEADYMASTHYKNASGVGATCADCHVPPSLGGMLVRKVKAVNEVAATLRGTIDTPEKFDARRLTMAKRVWAEMEKGDSRECRSCHGAGRFDYAAFKDKKGAQRMEKGLDDGQTCIACHKGLVHKMPDMSSGFKVLHGEMAAKAKDTPPGKGDAYALDLKSFYLNADDGQASGRILPATHVTVLGKEGDRLKIRINGWQQDGVDAVIYALKGRRIFYTVLGKKARPSVEQLGSEIDPDTDIVWNRVCLTGYTDADLLYTDLARLWDYGREMWSASCSSCHSPTPPDHFTANLWIGNLKSMKPQLSLTKNEYRFLQTYLQFHASDTGGSPAH